MLNEGGFTLIELLIVLAIMGILVGITALSLGGVVASSEDTGMNGEKDQVRTAIDAYNTEKALGDTCCTAIISARRTPVQVTSAKRDLSASPQIPLPSTPEMPELRKRFSIIPRLPHASLTQIPRRFYAG